MTEASETKGGNVGAVAGTASDGEKTIKELMRAARDGHVATVTRLLDQGVDVDSRDRHGNTALMVAAAQGRAEVVRILLERGADVHARNTIGRTPLMAAATFEPPDMVSTEIHGVSLAGQAKGSGRPRKDKRKRSLRSVVVMLIRAGADLVARDHEGRTALELIDTNERHDIEPLPTVGFILRETEKKGLKGLDRIERGGRWTTTQTVLYFLLIAGLVAISIYTVYSK